MIQQFERLTDAEITCWSGVEMALTEGREEGEVWDDVTVPFLQMLYIDAKLADGTCLRFGTEQADDLWGLSVNDSDAVGCDASGWDGIYRSGMLSSLPRGIVRGVEVATADSLIDHVKPVSYTHLTLPTTPYV